MWHWSKWGKEYQVLHGTKPRAARSPSCSLCLQLLPRYVASDQGPRHSPDLMIWPFECCVSSHLSGNCQSCHGPKLSSQPEDPWLWTETEPCYLVSQKKAFVFLHNLITFLKKSACASCISWCLQHQTVTCRCKAAITDQPWKAELSFWTYCYSRETTQKV